MAGTFDKTGAGGSNVATLAKHELEPACIALGGRSVYWVNEGSGAISKTGRSFFVRE
jgi:hypothetical protein